MARPTNKALAKHGRGSKGVRGRPKGDSAIINEYKQRMLASPKSRLVLEKIFEAALDDEHKNQSAAWKLVMDRVVPVSYFEKDKFGGKAPTIDININVGDNSTVSTEQAVDVEFEHVEESDE